MNDEGGCRVPSQTKEELPIRNCIPQIITDEEKELWKNKSNEEKDKNQSL